MEEKNTSGWRKKNASGWELEDRGFGELGRTSVSGELGVIYAVVVPRTCCGGAMIRAKPVRGYAFFLRTSETALWLAYSLAHALPNWQPVSPTLHLIIISGRKRIIDL